MGGVAFVGLDYQAVDLCYRLKPPVDTTLEEAWWGVRVLEARALELMRADAKAGDDAD